MSSIDIQCKAQAWLYEFKKWHGKHSSKKVSIPQKWRKPAAGWIKVNFGGAWDERHDQGGCNGAACWRDQIPNAGRVHGYSKGCRLCAAMGWGV
ncbi:hypothetical protein ACFX1S_043562 [Malus domestica]